MMRCLFVLTLALAGASPIEAEPATSRLALGGLDPVSVIEGDQAPGDADLAAEHEGYLYRFSSRESLSRFRNDPDRYSIQDGGSCMAMSGVSGSPDRFLVHDGRIYLFGSDNCRRRFTKAPELFLVDETERNEIMGRMSRLLIDSYVFPDTARRIVDRLDDARRAGAFSHVAGTARLTHLLNSELREAANDRHLWLRFDGRREDAGELESRLERYGFINFGFRSLRRLEGNIGYLELSHFVDPDIAGETAAHMMSLLGNSAAVIVDLRENQGGSPAMVAFLASYFFEPGRIHLNDIYWRDEDRTDQWWTIPFVPGKRMPEVSLFILTSGRTFSAAEEFAYDLQSLERAIVVGEPTAGGAHPSRRHILSKGIVLQVPVARSINPVTGTNWEGAGVAPDVEVPAEEALAKAHLMAVESLLDAGADGSRRAELERARGRLGSELGRDD